MWCKKMKKKNNHEIFFFYNNMLYIKVDFLKNSLTIINLS
jgi:hypothetical protein